MKLRTGLAAQLVVLLAFVLAILGVFVERETRVGLIAQVDQRLDGAVIQRLNDVNRESHTKGAPAPSPPRSPNADADADADANGFPATATIVFDAAGTVSVRRPSGVNDRVDAFPSVNALWAAGHVGRSGIVNAVNGSLRYRARAARTSDGGLLVEAAPLRSVDASVARLRRTLVLGVIGVLLAAALAVSRLVARSLRPLTQIASSASIVAGGDLDRRVAVPTRYVELNQLGGALDHMVDELTTALSEGTKALGVEASSRERLRRFAADASHELQTPVTSIRGWAELYRIGGLAEKAPLDAAMLRIEREASRMGRLVDDLLLLARADAQRPLSLAPVDLIAVCHDAVAAARAIDPMYPIDFAYGPTGSTGGPVEVSGDADQLRQVVDNLLANVRAHTDPGTRIRIAARSQDSAVVLTVADDGPGFPPEAVDHVFDRFWRDADRIDRSDSPDRHARGYGLGLAIVRAIVVAHGGSVEAANIEPHGARVTVRLPGADS